MENVEQPLDNQNKQTEQKADIERKITEIQQYYGKSLTEIVLMLARKPIVRHFKGNYYRVLGVGNDCTAEYMVVCYEPIGGADIKPSTALWTRELLDFLEPVPDNRQEQNVTGQKRRFEIISDYKVQLDLVPTKDLINELSARESDLIHLDKKDVLEQDYCIAHFVTDPETGESRLHNLMNFFDTREQADENLKRNKRSGKYRGHFRVIRRIFTLDID